MAQSPGTRHEKISPFTHCLARSLSRKEVLSILAIVAAGALLRWSYLHEIIGSPEFRFPTVDALFNDYWARGLATGTWTSPQIEQAYDTVLEIQKHPYFRPPGYPYFLAAIYGVFGLSYLAVRIVQMILGLVNSFLAFLLGRSLISSRVGLVYAALMSSYWIFIYFEGELQEPVFLVFLSLCLMHLLVLLTHRLTLTRSLVAGILLGACVLVRANLLVFVPFVIGWAWWFSRRKTEGRGFGALLAGLSIGLLVAVAPVTIRNYVVSGDLVLISSNDGINLYIGNNRYSNGMFVASAPRLNRFTNCFEYERIVSELEDSLGTALSHSAVSAYYRKEALSYIQRHPWEFLRRVFRKAYLFWGPHEITLNRVVHLNRKFSSTLSSIPGDFSSVLASAVLGIAMMFVDGRGRSSRFSCWRVKPETTYEGSVAILLFILASWVSFLPFFVTAVYRAPVIPFLLVFAAYALCRLGQLLRERAFRTASLWVVAGGVLYVLFRIPLIGYEPGLSKWHFDRGLAYALDHQDENALTEYRHAIQANPRFPEVHNNVARVLARMGRFDEAINELSRAIELDPGDAMARFGLANMLERQGRTVEAIHQYREAIRAGPQVSMPYCNLGILLLREGHPEEAAGLFEKAIEINPNDLRSMNNLAWLLATSQTLENRDGTRAVELAEEVCEATDYSDAESLDTLAAAYAEVRRFSDAIAIAERALAHVADNNGEAKAMRDRLALYRQHEPYRRQAER